MKLYEALVNDYLNSKGVRSAHEKRISKRHKFTVDSLIERSDAFKENIEKFQKIVSLPQSINLISIDYTFSSDLGFIEDKLYKSYQSKDRYFIIVLLGLKNPYQIKELNDMLQDARDGDKDGSEYLDHVQIITAKEYKEFLGLDGNFEKIFKQYQKYSVDLFRSNDYWDDALRYSNKAFDYIKDLKSSSNNWLWADGYLW